MAQSRQIAVSFCGGVPHLPRLLSEITDFAKKRGGLPISDPALNSVSVLPRADLLKNSKLL